MSSTSADGVGGQPRLVQPVPQGGGDGHVGADGRRRAPQQHGVARLQAQPGGVAGHVGPVLVDDADHAEGDPHPLDPQAVGPHPAVDHLARPGRAAPPPCAARRPWPPPGGRRGGAGRGRWRRRRPARPAPDRRRWPPGRHRSAPPAGRRPGGGPRCGRPTRPRATRRLAAWARWPSSVIGVDGLDCTVSAYLPGPAPSRRAPPGGRAQLQHHQVVPVDHLGGDVVGQLVGAPPGPPATTVAGWPTRPLAKTCPVRVGDLHGVVGGELRPGRRPPRPAAATGPARPGPGGPRHRPRWCPRPRRRRRSTACGPAAGGPGAGSGCPPPGPTPGPRPAPRAGRRRR